MRYLIKITLLIMLLTSCENRVGEVVASKVTVKCIISKKGRKTSYDLPNSTVILQDGLIIIYDEKGGGLIAQPSDFIELKWIGKK